MNDNQADRMIDLLEQLVGKLDLLLKSTVAMEPERKLCVVPGCDEADCKNRKDRQ